MKQIIAILVGIVYLQPAAAQLTMPADGTSVRATVSERIGLTDVTVNYGRPAVKGRDGKIWGEVVHTGFQNLGFGNGLESPWRAGANENTTIEFSTDVMIEGKALPAGKYGLFVAYQPVESAIIFSKATTSWGSYFYDPAEDALRVNVKSVKLQESRERLTYQFGEQTDSSAIIRLEWERLGLPFKVSTKLHQLQMASFERELRGEKGFDPHALVQVASYLLEHNTNFDDALGYINRAASSMPVFSVYLTKAQILAKMNKQSQADSIITAAIGKGTASEVHNYARSLQREGKQQKAFEVFQQNFKRYPNTYTTSMGMARGYSGIGKSKEALKYANQALPLAPDAANKKAVEDMIAKLKEGKEI